MSRFYTGNSGASTGPHLDFRVYNPQTGKYENPSSYTSYMTVNGQPFDFQVTSPFGMRTHPIHGDQRMHNGIDYATPIGTPIDIDGQHLSTWDDSSGGGRMSQYLIQTEDGPRELLLLHGSDGNKSTGGGPDTDYDIDPSSLPESTASNSDAVLKEVKLPDTEETPEPDPVQTAKERVARYKDMSASALNAEYDKLRAEDPAKAREYGMEMHKAHFGKL